MKQRHAYCYISLARGRSPLLFCTHTSISRQTLNGGNACTLESIRESIHIQHEDHQSNGQQVEHHKLNLVFMAEVCQYPELARHVITKESKASVAIYDSGD